MNEVNLNLTLHVEANCMWFINEIKLKANMQVDVVNSNLTLQVDASCMESN
jgi:hypothetical protein